jgi:glycerol-3-phosphate dehydrogenase subunit C
VFSDQGYFAEIGGLDRLRVANHTYDLGEYLRSLHESGELKLELAQAPGRLEYFAPCHQRQQGIGQPWTDLLRLLPHAAIERIGDGFDCCGQGGLMGFKNDYHETSLKIGARLIDKIRAAAPERLVTDCLSCRVQFQHTMPFERFTSEVSHPVEILRDAYRRFRPASPLSLAQPAQTVAA